MTFHEFATGGNGDTSTSYRVLAQHAVTGKDKQASESWWPLGNINSDAPAWRTLNKKSGKERKGGRYGRRAAGITLGYNEAGHARTIYIVVLVIFGHIGSFPIVIGGCTGRIGMFTNQTGMPGLAYLFFVQG